MTTTISAAETDPPGPITMAKLTAALQIIATADIRNLPPAVPHFEPFRCHRCLDTKTVPDWENWSPAWLWQRYRPVPHMPCPDCGPAAAGHGAA